MDRICIISSTHLDISSWYVFSRHKSKFYLHQFIKKKTKSFIYTGIWIWERDLPILPFWISIVNIIIVFVLRKKKKKTYICTILRRWYNVFFKYNVCKHNFHVYKLIERINILPALKAKDVQFSFSFYDVHDLPFCMATLISAEKHVPFRLTTNSMWRI